MKAFVKSAMPPSADRARAGADGDATVARAGEAAATAVAVRRAARADAEALAPLLGALGYTMESAVAAERLDALLASARDAVLVAEGGGGAVLGVLALHWGAMLHQPAPVARIGSLVVAEEARGRGVGARLVREAAAVARAEGCAVLELTTGRQRHAAHAFYAAQGFAWTALRFARALDEGEMEER